MTPAPTAEGLLLVDKPTGITSFGVVARVRRRLRVRQVGHCGTLDPLASGLLPVLVGEATKLAPWTAGFDKTYLAVARLGAATDSYDAAGTVTRSGDPSSVEEPALRSALARFVGRIRQRPPAFSAIKREGQPLYRLARKTAAAGGSVEDIEVAEREVDVHAIELIAFTRPDVTLRIHCSKGTYIRSIAHALGETLGCHAHLASLRRERVGPFLLEQAIRLEDAPDPLALLPPALAVAHLPAITVDAATETELRRGQQHALATLAAPPDVAAVRLLSPDARLVAIATPDAAGRLKLARVMAAR